MYKRQVIVLIAAAAFFAYRRRNSSSSSKSGSSLDEPLLENEMTPLPTHAQTSIPQTSIPQTSIPQTSIPHTSIPHTSIPQTSIPVPLTSLPFDDELDGLLVPLGLVEYAHSFRANGYDTVDDIRAMDLEKLKEEVGMKSGHAKRLLRHLQQQQKSKGGSSWRGEDV